MSSKILNIEYEIGEIIYLKTDEDQKQRIVFAIVVYRNEFVYRCSCGTVMSDHYDFEMSRELDTTLKTNN
ncbi:MAG TPA: hypothetical protein VIM07_00805 [Chitinophagaceae bacterium]